MPRSSLPPWYPRLDIPAQTAETGKHHEENNRDNDERAIENPAFFAFFPMSMKKDLSRHRCMFNVIYQTLPVVYLP